MKINASLRNFLFGSILLLASPSHADSGTWNVDADGDWNVASNWLNSIIADGSGSTAHFSFDLTANRTVTLGADRTIGHITFTDSSTNSNDLTISGANILTLAGTSPTIDITQADRTVTVSSEIAGTSGLTKTGLGTIALNGSVVNTFTGGINVSGGSLALNYANIATPTNLINSSNALSLGGGGRLTLTGQDSATDTVQSFNGMTSGIGRNTLTLTKGASATSATLNLGALTVNPGSVTTLLTGTGTTTWVTGVTPIAEIINITSINGNALPASGKVNVNAGLFYRQSTSAGAIRWVSVDSAGILQALPVSIAAQGTSGTVNVARQISTANITLVGNAESYGLLVNSNNAARQLSLDSFTYTINGIIGVNTNLGTITPGTSGRLIIGAEKNLVITNDNTGGIAISAPIDNNGSSGGVGGTASDLTIVGTIPSGTPGNVTLSGTNTYTGHTYINNANVILGNDSALGTTDSGTTLIGGPIGSTAGTTLNLGGTGLTISENIHLNGNKLGRTRIFNSASVNHVINGNIDVTSDTGFAQIWNNAGSITINGNITGTITNSLFLLRGNSGSTNNRILGDLNITGNLSKTEGGEWLIGAAGKTYSWGNTAVSFGTLRMGSDNVLPSATVVTFGTNTNTATLDLNGFSQTVAGIQHQSTWNGTAALTITSATAATLTVGEANPYNYGGVMTGSLALTKTGSGTLTLSGINTYSGGTIINGGTLALGANDVLPDTGMLSIGTATLNAANFDDTLGALNVTGAAIINLSSGANLVFADSSEVGEGEWAGTLTITGTFVPGNLGSLRFGSDNTGLEPEQLAAISATGWSSFSLDTNGYLTAIPDGGNTFANWLIVNPPATGFDIDTDKDGIPNGVENVLGSNPNTFNAGLTEISSTPTSVTFKHTLNPTIASDVSYNYEWSTDLVEWKTHGQTNTGGTTATVAASAPVLGVVTVTVTITDGPSAKLFGRLVATN